MSEARIQLRGICQCCGREQAVVNGYMSQHGYDVEQGYFRGVCPGRDFAPMQQSREQTDRIVAKLRQEAPMLVARAEEYRAGNIVPELAAEGPWYKAKMILFADASKYQQQAAVKEAIAACEGRARAATSIANTFERLADEYYGKPLKEEKVQAGPAPIARGDRRVGGGGFVLIAQRIERGRVYWTSEDGTKKSWTGTAAWRRFDTAAA